MFRAIGAKLEIKTNEKEAQFYGIVQDLLDMDFVQRLDGYVQHRGTSRLQHSIDVAYRSFRMAKMLQLDYRSAARGALLHDLYYTQWRETGISGWKHAITHPKDALANAQEATELNEIEKDIIVKHMWPLTIVPPKYAESHIVSLADKICTVAEVLKRKSK